MRYNRRVVLLSLAVLFLVIPGMSAATIHTYYSFISDETHTGIDVWDRIFLTGTGYAKFHGEADYWWDGGVLQIAFYIQHTFTSDMYIKISADWELDADVRAFAGIFRSAVVLQVYYFHDPESFDWPFIHPAFLTSYELVANHVFAAGPTWPFYWTEGEFIDSRGTSQWYENDLKVKGAQTPSTWCIGVYIIIELSNYAEIGESYSDPGIFDLDVLKWQQYWPG